MSWVDVPQDCDFSLGNLPYGVFSTGNTKPRIGVAIGGFVLDLARLSQDHAFDDLGPDIASSLCTDNLNDYAALGRPAHRLVRKRLQDLLAKDTTLGHVLKDDKERRGAALVPLQDVQMHLPMSIGNYTDFFAGLPHAELVGVLPGQHLKITGQVIENIAPIFQLMLPALSDTICVVSIASRSRTALEF